MKDWFRRKTWTNTDEEEFFAKLKRARNDGRVRYLKIQAIELVETRENELLWLKKLSYYILGIPRPKFLI